MASPTTQTSPAAPTSPASPTAPPRAARAASPSGQAPAPGQAAVREPAAVLDSEYEALIDGCGLVDRSERGKLALTGSGAAEFLNGQVTNDVAALTPGEGCYAAFLTHKGKMLGDLRVLALGGAEAAAEAARRGEGEAGAVAGAQPETRTSVAGRPAGAVAALLLDTERVALQALFDMIRRFKVGYEVELHKRTLERSLLSLVGPRARAVACAAADAGAPVEGAAPGASEVEVALEAEHSHRRTRLAGVEVRLVATEAGGVDVLCDADARDAVWSALLLAGATPVGEAAAEVVRVERGVPRYGIDVDDTTIPQEAGLNERAVSFTKGCYVGQETVARLHYRGKPNRHLRGLRLPGPAPTGAELRLGERVVGTLGSAVVSPRLGPIGLALVRREAEPGARVLVQWAGAPGVEAEVVALPFE
jgi:folate-binding protein YgfZ